MSISEEYDEFQHKCDWCGKPGVSIMWSGRKGLYCSFRCNAAGSYRSIVVLAIVVTIIVGIVLTVFLRMVLMYPTVTLHPILLVLPLMLVFLDLTFIYCAYTGRAVRRERERGLEGSTSDE